MKNHVYNGVATSDDRHAYIQIHNGTRCLDYTAKMFRQVLLLYRSDNVISAGTCRSYPTNIGCFAWMHALLAW